LNEFTKAENSMAQTVKILSYLCIVRSRSVRRTASLYCKARLVWVVVTCLPYPYVGKLSPAKCKPPLPCKARSRIAEFPVKGLPCLEKRG